MGEEEVTSVAGRDVLVVLRSELASARAALRDAASVGPQEPRAKDVAQAARRLTLAADALDARIRATYDAVLLERSAAAFRTAAAALGTLLNERHAQRKESPDVQRVLKRVVIHAREIGRLTRESGAAHVGAAIESLSEPEAWTGPVLDALVGLVDALSHFSRERLGEQARARQLSSLVDRASSTAVVSSLHALRDLALRARSEPTVMKDRFQLDGALKAPIAGVVERLSAWFKLEDEGRRRLHLSLETFTRRLLDHAAQSG